MSDWNVVRLPTFDDDFEKHQVDVKKFEKWVGDLKKAPMTIKNAHALHGYAKPLWSAHFNPGGTNYPIIYFLCDGRPMYCFMNHGIERHINEKYESLIKHSCDKNKKLIILFRLDTHSIYDKL